MPVYKLEITINARNLIEARESADRIDNESSGDWRIVVREADEREPGSGVYCEGCEHCVFPGVRWPTAINSDETHEWVERCDSCERFDSDEDARDWLVETYGPDTIATDFTVGDATAFGLPGLRPYLDGPNVLATPDIAEEIWADGEALVIADADFRAAAIALGVLVLTPAIRAAMDPKALAQARAALGLV